MIKIKVPATTANMGAGFDCVGMALNMYNYLSANESDYFSIDITGDAHGILATKDNLIYQAVLRLYAEIGKPAPNLHLASHNNIPIARGLGSSAACVVAGLMAANELAGKPLPKSELARLACEMEGHPDNTTPAIFGGMVVSAMDGGRLYYSQIFPVSSLSFAALIPNFKVKTEDARGVLPNNYSAADAIFNISRAALFVASMENGDVDNLRAAVKDKIHQPYRAKLIPYADKIFDMAENLGAYGVFISGSGSTIIAIIDKAHEQQFQTGMLSDEWEVHILQPDLFGARIDTEGE